MTIATLTAEQEAVVATGMLERVVPNAALAARGLRREFLVFPAAGLCPCTLVAGEGEVTFRFDISGLAAARVRGLSRADRLRFLVAVAELEPLAADFEFSLELGNLMVDVAGRPRVLLRDVASADSGAGFPDKYLALCGMVLGKGSYADYLSGSRDLFRHDALLAELRELGSVTAIRDRLVTAWARSSERERAVKTLVSKRRLRTLQVLVPLLVVVLGAAAVFAVIYRERAESSDRVVQAAQGYIGGDFVAVQQALAGVPVSELSFEARHLLARSYVATQPIGAMEREWVLASLTRMAEGELFDYWIHMGRLEFSYALEIAARFGETSLMLYVYQVEQAFVEADMTLSHGERTARIDELGRAIVELEAVLDQARESQEGQ
ncbi:MAG: hypothetical protein FWD83_06880 [Promicromonosporaceae bacterium]|nr:hypothetical protein [Promicromonosporaceae bacterium]